MSEYRCVLAPQGSLRPYKVELRAGEAWVFVRWAKSETEGKRIINGLALLSRATSR